MNDLECFKIGEIDFPLVPASPFRNWMDAFPDRHPYRCLPLSIANAHAWHILSPFDIEVTWNGDEKVSDLTVSSTSVGDEKLAHVAMSNFSRGIVTFHVGYIFRTPEDWSIITSGPANEPKDGIYPLTGIIETDWLPYPFTMNWQMTRPGIVRFEKDEPICSIIPIPKSYMEAVTPKIYERSDDPVLDYEHEAFKDERMRYNVKRKSGDEDAKKRAWQKHYFTGRMPDGNKIDGHTNKLRLKKPISCIGQTPALSIGEARVDAEKIKEIELDAKSKTSETSSSEPVKEIQCTHMFQPTQTKQKTNRIEVSSEVVFTKKKKKKNNTKWSASSFLNNIKNEQSDLNISGRLNVSDGTLIKAAKFHIEDINELDTSAFDFSINDSFLTKEECAYLVRVLDESREILDEQEVSVDFWKGRILFLADIYKTHHPAYKIIIDAIKKETEHIQNFYQLTQPIYCDVINIVYWPEGKFMPAHADNANPDGSPHGMAYRDFSSICYLNDDYEGGNVYFTTKDTTIRPKTGRNLSFTGGFHHEHGVLKVTKGNRYSLAAFYTFDESKKDPWVYNER